MSDSVVVYTSVFGQYDRLRDPVPQDVAADWVCFTDSVQETRSWNMVPRSAPWPGDNRRSAKYFKLQPHVVVGDYDWTIWIDANIQIDSPSFVREAMDLAQGGLGLFRHPQRRCIYSEARALARLEPRQYGGKGVLRQVAAYRALGHPNDWGLYAGGVIVRRSHAPMAAFFDRWWEHCQRWTARDQLSLPFVARAFGIRPSTFPFHLHRHTVVGGVLCRSHRIELLDRLANRTRRVRTARDAASVAEATTDSGAPWRWNPWFEIVPHGGAPA